MFLFSWFGIPQPRFYICLKVVRSASFVRPTTSAPSFCPRRLKDSWCVEVCPSALHLRIKKFEPCCRSNGGVALRTSATLHLEGGGCNQAEGAAWLKKKRDSCRSNGVVALRTSATLRSKIPRAWKPPPPPGKKIPHDLRSWGAVVNNHHKVRFFLRTLLLYDCNLL